MASEGWTPLLKKSLWRLLRREENLQDNIVSPRFLCVIRVSATNEQLRTSNAPETESIANSPARHIPPVKLV